MAKMRVRPRRSKFGAVRTTVDYITFHSKAEARRYQELRLMEKAGQIRDLTLQPKFALAAYQADTHYPKVIGHYVGDFSYIEAGERVIEDVKGLKTPMYRWKRKHMLAQYQILIRETR